MYMLNNIRTSPEILASKVDPFAAMMSFDFEGPYQKTGGKQGFPGVVFS
jgi:hypothetical protein